MPMPVTKEIRYKAVSNPKTPMKIKAYQRYPGRTPDASKKSSSGLGL
jgi:hypothetical protein